jgi:hypothetical protein
LPREMMQCRDPHLAGQPGQKAKDILMRVGFEPTPFRTSDCIIEPRMVSP